jgi:hypothetical protein
VILQGLCNVSSCAAIDQSNTVVRGSYSANISDARAYLQDLASFVMESFHDLDAEEVVSMERSVAGLFAGLTDGLFGIFAQRNEKNEADNGTAALPVLPHLLVNIRTSKICRLILKSEPRLVATEWTSSSIELIERDHRD